MGVVTPIRFLEREPKAGGILAPHSGWKLLVVGPDHVCNSRNIVPGLGIRRSQRN